MHFEALHRAVVAIKPWHTDVFTPAMLKSSPEIFRFLESTVVDYAAKLFPARAQAIAPVQVGWPHHFWATPLIAPALRQWK